MSLCCVENLKMENKLGLLNAKGMNNWSYKILINIILYDNGKIKLSNGDVRKLNIQQAC